MPSEEAGGFIIHKRRSGSSRQLGGLAGKVHYRRSGAVSRELQVSGKVYQEAHLIWLWFTGEFPTKNVLHVNGDSLDNRIANLRIVSPETTDESILEEISTLVGSPTSYRTRAKGKTTALEKILQDLEKIAEFDPTVGRFRATRTRQGSKIQPGEYIGFIKSRGYRHMILNGRDRSEHELVWLWCTGELPTEIDHINGDRADNRPENLRNVPRKINQRNKCMSSLNSSGYAGVTLRRDGKKWDSRVKVDGVVYHRGCFDTPEEAYQARLDFIAAHPEWGFSERHGES